MAEYSIIIKNGIVFDGKGNKPENVDIGIVGDEIKAIGDLSNEIAAEIIDAGGKYVAPGFIDLTNHSDTHWTIFSYPSQEGLLRQGITTILGGSCGSSLAPLIKESDIEEIQRWMDVSGMNINWRTMSEFLSEIEKHKIGVNFCTLVGFNTIQQSILGGESRMPALEEINQMKFLLKSSLEDGAFGISAHFGLSSARLLESDEAADLFKVAKKYNAIIKHHLEDEGEDILPSVSRIISIARKSGAKTHITHFKALGRASWPMFPNAIEMIKNAINEGVALTCDFFPYTKTGSKLITLLPSWFRKLSNKESLNILKSKDDPKRKILTDHLKEFTLHYDKITIASGGGGLGIAGKTVEELSAASGLSGEEIILKLLETNDLRVSIFSEVISEENIELIAKEKFSAIASDGIGYSLPISPFGENRQDLPHPRSFGAFPKAFNLLVKQKKILPWETLIYKMTGLPAGILGFKNRGVIAKGNKADVIIFSPGEISDFATYDNPFRYSKGISDVLVNGTIVLSEGEFIEGFAGRVLRRA